MAKGKKLLKEAAESRKPLGVCQVCHDRVSYYSFKEKKICPTCMKAEAV